MKRVSENQVGDGILTDYFSPGSKVRDFYPPHPNPGFPQETPMKPSQIPNTQPPRSHLPIHSPDWLYRPPRQPPWSLRNRHHPNHQNDGSVWNGDGENYPLHRHFQSNSPHETFHRHPVSPTRRQNPQGSRYQDTNGQATYWPNERDQQERVAVGPQKNDRTGQEPNTGNTPLLSGSESETFPFQCSESFRLSSTLEQTPVQDQGDGASFPPAESSTSKPGESSLVVQMSVMKPCEQPLLSGLERGTGPLQRSKSWSPSSTLKQASVKDQGRRGSFPPADSSTPTQNQPDHPTLSNETLQKKDSCHVLKRHRESGSDDDNAKKQCLKPAGPDVMLQCPTANVVSPDSCSQKPLCGLELFPESSNNHSRTESTHLNGINRSPSPHRRLKSCLKQIPMGAKQACIKSTQNNLVILESPSKRSEVLEKTEEDMRSKMTHKNVSFSLPNMPNDPKSPSRSHMARDANTVDSMSQKTVAKQNTNPSSCRKLRRNKKLVVADDLQDLFMPDPTTYIVNLGQKTLKTRPDVKPKPLKSDKNGSSTSASSNPQTLGPKLCQKEKTVTMSSQASNTIVKIPVDMDISLPRVLLTRIPLPTTNVISVAKPEHVGKDVATPVRISVSRTDRQIEEKGHEDSLDLDLELNFDSDLEVISTHSSSSNDDSEDVQLVSLHEIMTKKDKPEKEKPERGALSHSSSVGNGQHSGHHHTVSSTKTGNCKDRLDQLLKEFTESKRARETEMELLATCQEDLLKIAEYEEAESKEEPISDEQQQFLQRFSLASSAIRDVPPGHEVFNLEKFGRLFDQNTLQLRQCTVTPQNRAQKTLLWSSHSQFRLNVTIDVFQEAYNNSPCPFQITRFLFKMLSVHSDQTLSDKILQALNDIAVTAAVQRVNGENEEFKVWVPSLADLTLVLMNMGAPFVSLFPLESLQPPFTERDLLEDIYVKSERPSKQEPRRFPEHNFTNIYKYLSLCLRLCPRFYSDSELLQLLALLCTVRLESRLLLQSRVPFYPLLYRLLKNIRRWDDMMPKMCQALTDLTDDHHNMCHLIQLLPHHRRGLNLRQHLSVAMISKLLDGSCSYTPRSKELQLSDLPYLPRMKPSSLLRIIMASSQRSHTEGEDDQTLLDQQTYYLLYSLLTLVNEATNFQRFPAHQKEQLLLLCSELERHIKCHIREGEKWLYRSKVKDLVARIYTKWQMTLQKTRPLNGKLYDYWQPLQSDVRSSQDVEEIESSQDAAKTGGISDSEEEPGARTEDGEEEEVIQIEATRNEGEETASTAEWPGPSHAAEELDTKGTEVGEMASKSTLKDCEDMETEGGSPSVGGLSPGPPGPSTSKAV